jgi:hypothetical protein
MRAGSLPLPATRSVRRWWYAESRCIFAKLTRWCASNAKNMLRRLWALGSVRGARSEFLSRAWPARVPAHFFSTEEAEEEKLPKAVKVTFSLCCLKTRLHCTQSAACANDLFRLLTSQKWKNGTFIIPKYLPGDEPPEFAQFDPNSDWTPLSKRTGNSLHSFTTLHSFLRSVV